ncbi:MAG: YebC/PmpR family DNA-binding transcriptional regulator [Thermoanaerobaculia bacterium]|nr:YebC/PmpR family DNA-binding transcriptional regulator [Thermoanaerobaculia bacterium]
MAGHSKWAQIKRKKAVTDARRGKLWSRILKEITVAARLGGGDPAGNPRLRAGIAEAKAANVPNDNIDKAIRRGTGELEGVALEETTYEGYGPGGVAVLIEAVTDNRNRTVAEIRHIFSRHGGNLGENGCVGWLFRGRGYFAIPRDLLSEEEFLELAVELEAEDFSTDDDEVYELTTAPEEYERIGELLEEREIPPESRELAKVPSSYVELEGEAAAQMMRLIEALEDQDDVQNVWANFDLDEAAVVA